MIEQMLRLTKRIDLAPDSILMLDGDILEVTIIRNGEKMGLLNIGHYAVDDNGQRIPALPLPIKIVIEKAEAQGNQSL